MQSNPVVHFEIYVDDMPRAVDFYQKVLGTTLQAMPSPIESDTSDTELWFFEMAEGDAMKTYGSGGMLVKMDGFAPGPGGSIVYFACEDCGVQLDRIKALGYEIKQSKTSIGEHGFCGLAADSEGNIIGFHSMK